MTSSDKRIALVADGFFTVEEACEWLRTTRSSLYAAMQRGEIPYVKKLGRRLIPRRALMLEVAADIVGV